MVVANGKTMRMSDAIEVSAEVDGFRLWYRVPSTAPVVVTGDAFLSAALLPAMVEGKRLEIQCSLPVSPRLLKSVGTLQEIYHSWNSDLKPIQIRACVESTAPVRPDAMSFFSGGVDSTFTLLKHLEEIGHVVFVQGFDFYCVEGESAVFSVADVSDLSQLAHKIMLSSDGVSTFLRGRLPRETREALALYQHTKSPSGALDLLLARSVEEVLSGDSVYDRARFAGIQLRDETKRVLEESKRGDDNRILNRLLLEDAYPLEIARRDRRVYRRAIERNTRYVRTLGKQLIAVGTNHFAFGYRYNLSRNLTQGSALASVASLLGFSRVYVPGAYSYSQLIPLGSHPLTDPLWSTEAMEIVHDGGEAMRVEKLVRIVRDKAALENLRVCLDDMNTNCGRCSKCLRTMIPLKLLGATNAPFPVLPGVGAVRRMKIANDIEMIFLSENLTVDTDGADENLVGALRSCIKKYERRRVLKEIDRVFLGGRVGRCARMAARGNKRIHRVDFRAFAR